MADAYKPYISGVTNYIDLNKRVLEDAGHEVYVFTFGDVDYQDDEARVIRSPGLALGDTGFYLSLRYKTQARKLLQTMDVIHVHHPFLSGRLALRYCRARQIPVIYTNHTRYDLYAQARLPDHAGRGKPGIASGLHASFLRGSRPGHFTIRRHEKSPARIQGGKPY